ncbi:response regulator [Candidatus Woesearchaeota archaeon]|nr:response regulator [Candidatus Woesearchaeota archaeon]
MIVDDDEDILYSVEKLLTKKTKYEILKANGGKKCLSLLKKKEPDLILLDIMMPEMDGWDVVEKIHENQEWKNIPIIFLTAKDDKLTQTVASISVEDYIVKPVDIDLLIKRIEKTLNKTG